ncbi:MAG: hypothetical protein HC836_10495 [Richelia sp. RM2_1_2]|nr:hypothetical protein [Richelia sp. RM2_1_2]
MTNIGGYCGVDWDVIINADTSLKSYISFYNANDAILFKFAYNTIFEQNEEN